MKLITSATCNVCERIEAQWPDVPTLDMDTPDGMAELAMLSLPSLALPVLITDDGVYTGEDVVNVLSAHYG